MENGENPKDYCLHILKNVYGQKQAGRVWNKHLVRNLKSIGFKQSAFDDCLFYRGNVLYLLYVDNSLLCGPDPDELDQAIKDMQSTELELTEEGNIADFRAKTTKRYTSLNPS